MMSSAQSSKKPEVNSCSEKYRRSHRRADKLDADEYLNYWPRDVTINGRFVPTPPGIPKTKVKMPRKKKVKENTSEPFQCEEREDLSVKQQKVKEQKLIKLHNRDISKKYWHSRHSNKKS